ncbi:BTB/POZ domain-containing protein [Paenibacillus macquariensis]|uniref:Uncharacterized protein n=1 Tax=Paenibacillus macquariensis TaxID=948756 RepID=A0ABY1K1I2_9BACL|nr:hypothetical protein [Paenibacillus macquariensis]MEC0091780.1 hypothetical protein [Paenibacillus macquariensis]OAB32303.1 hypothetical protein PMSM_16980 [Paenibacillus macquariensis subsp. macquariensis]SIR12127.1 hypothetical protein SAMN05421578_107135 [Paenibacillus macquariensis]
MLYLTPEIYIIKRMRKLVEEDMDKSIAVTEQELIEKIAMELRSGVSNIDTIESTILDFLDDMPFGISKVKVITNIYKRRSLSLFKMWEEYLPMKSRILVGNTLKNYKDQIVNGAYEHIENPELNLSIQQVKWIDECDYLSDIEYYLPDFMNERANLEKFESQITKFVEMYKRENPCYAVIDLDVAIDEVYYTVSGEPILVKKILAAAYYGEAKGENGRFIGTAISCVEGDILPADYEVTTNNNIFVTDYY